MDLKLKLRLTVIPLIIIWIIILAFLDISFKLDNLLEINTSLSPEGRTFWVNIITFLVVLIPIALGWAWMEFVMARKATRQTKITKLDSQSRKKYLNSIIRPTLFVSVVSWVIFYIINFTLNF